MIKLRRNEKQESKDLAKQASAVGLPKGSLLNETRHIDSKMEELENKAQ